MINLKYRRNRYFRAIAATAICVAIFALLVAGVIIGFKSGGNGILVFVATVAAVGSTWPCFNWVEETSRRRAEYLRHKQSVLLSND